MDIGEAKALTHPRKSRKRVGRGHGSGQGKTAGRGNDGARSRSGWSSRNMTGGNMPLFRRLPRVGFSNAPFKKLYTIVNVGQFASFPANTQVNAETLRESGVVSQIAADGIKILGSGELDRSLAVRANAFSRSARDKIQAVGGTVELIPPPRKPVRAKMHPRPPRQEGEGK